MGILSTVILPLPMCHNTLSLFMGVRLFWQDNEISRCQMIANKIDQQEIYSG